LQEFVKEHVLAPRRLAVIANAILAGDAAGCRYPLSTKDVIIGQEKLQFPKNGGGEEPLLHGFLIALRSPGLHN